MATSPYRWNRSTVSSRDWLPGHQHVILCMGPLRTSESQIVSTGLTMSRCDANRLRSTSLPS